MSSSFDLVFEGVRESTEETVSRVQGIFVSELELDTTKAEQLLNSSPVIVKTSDDRSALERIYLILEEAGAQMRISPADAPQAETVEIPLGPPLELDDALWAGSAKKEEPSAPAPISTTASADDFGLELSVDPPATPSPKDNTPISTPAPAPSADGLVFKLDDADAPIPVKETPTVAPPPAPGPASELEFSLAEPPPAPAAAPTTAPTAPEEPQRVSSAPPKGETPEPPPAAADPDLGFSLSDAPAPPVSEPPTAPPVTAETIDTTISPLTPAPNPDFPAMRLADAQKIKREPDVAGGDGEASAAATGDSADPDLEEQTTTAGRMSPKLLAAIGVGGLLVGGVVNWLLFFSGTDAADADRFEQVAATMKFEPPQPVEVPVEQLAPPADPFAGLVLNFTGTDTTTEVKVLWKIDTLGSELVRIHVEMETPPTPELTPEEIVRGVPPHPGIKKVELDEAQIAYLGDGQFQGQGPAKVYVEQGDQRRRIIVPALFEGSFKPGDRELTAKLVVSNWSIGEPAGRYAIEAPSEGEISVFVRARFESLGAEPDTENSGTPKDPIHP